MCEFQLIPVFFPIPNPSALIGGIGSALYAAPISVGNFLADNGNYFADKHPATGEDIIVTYKKAGTAIITLVINGNNVDQQADALIGGRPTHRPTA